MNTKISCAFLKSLKSLEISNIYIFGKKNKVVLEKLFIGQPIKKVRASEYSPFETIHLLSETFFNILNNKRDI